MRTGAYRVFAIAAWPALAWCAAEVAIRAASGATSGLLPAALTGACAGATIVAARWRTRQLASATVQR